MTENSHTPNPSEVGNYSPYRWWKNGGHRPVDDSPESEDFWKKPLESIQNHLETPGQTNSLHDLRDSEQLPLEFELVDPHELADETGHPAGQNVRSGFKRLDDERSSSAQEDLGRVSAPSDEELTGLIEQGIKIDTRRGRRIAARVLAHEQMKQSHGLSGEINMTEADKAALGDLIDGLNDQEVARLRAQGFTEAEILARQRIKRERRGR